MAFPGDVNSLGSVSGSQTLAAAGHATRHNEVKTALEGIRDALGGTAVPSGTVQPILAAGSASAPSLSFTGDSNTGLWSPAEDTVAISTGGTERVRVTSLGRVGIGTTNPSGDIHVAQNATNAQVFLDSGAAHSAITFRRANTSLAAPSLTDSGTLLGDIQFRGYDGASYVVGAAVRGYVDTSAGSGDMPGRIGLWTAGDGSTTLIERMRIDNAGLITGTGTSLGAWTAYTPTLGGTGWALGDGSVAGRYMQIGKLVVFFARVTFGSTSTFGAGQLTVSLPVTGSSATIAYATGIYYDASLTNRHHATFEIDVSATAAACFTTASPMAIVSTTSPFTWATSDIVRISGIYQIA